MDALAEVLQKLLPEGIVFDSPVIYTEVAKLPVVPLEDIHRHWKTYTTTHKNLHDPTACRLEHFWWHVWGSNRRELSGKTLARMWEDIASGPTFVPLRGPPNRWEGPPVKPTRSMHESDTTATQQIKELNSQQQYVQAAILRGTPHNLTPSSARPPPPHPILKKPSGPSSTGPRPTARFADVPDSEGEAVQPSGGKNVQRNSKKKVDTRPSGPVPQVKMDKKPASTAKKYVVSSNAAKRRPVLPRRQSSQSSTGSGAGSTTGSITSLDTGSRDAIPGMKQAVNQRGPSASIREHSPLRKQSGRDEETAPITKVPAKQLVATSPETQLGSKVSSQTSSHVGLQSMPTQQTLSPTLKKSSGKENSSRSQSSSGEPRPSAKALGKRPVIHGGAAKPSSLRKSSQVSYFDGQGSQSSPPSSAVTPFTQTNVRSDPQAEKNDARSNDALEVSTPTRKEPVRRNTSSAAPNMVRSKSNNESKRLSAANFKSPSVVGLSSIAVTGGFDFASPKARPAADDLPPLAADQPDIRASSLLDSKLTPTQPSPAPAPPLGRSKSQLTLLLERARVGERSRASSHSSRRSDSSKEEGYLDGRKHG